MNIKSQKKQDFTSFFNNNLYIYILLYFYHKSKYMVRVIS